MMVVVMMVHGDYVGSHDGGDDDGGDNDGSEMVVVFIFMVGALSNIEQYMF
jgi:hypothetical protein